MGLLSEGSPLSWEDTHRLAAHVRTHGLVQFVNLYRRLRARTGDVLKWGDEVEYVLVKLDHQEKKARLSLRAKEVLQALRQKELQDPEGVQSLWRPEYGAYMVEGTPGKPYGGLMAHFNIVEANMKARRKEVRALLQPDEVVLTLTAFPRLGCPDFTVPASETTPDEGAAQSLFFPDQAIFQGHPRFSTLTRNIRQRRGEKVAINIPIFKDISTPDPYVENLSKIGDVDGKSQKAALPDHIYMDAMGFGMGCCCLQLTFQACNIEEAKTLYDQLAPLCPIMLALTAASPIHRGLLADVDCRWNVIAASVDCRTTGERGEGPLQPHERRIYKSRYDSIDSYLSAGGQKYNDIPLVLDENALKQLLSEGIEEPLARHVAHLFIRDPVSLFSEKVNQDDSKDTDHFENLQSTNWQTMRFKPPPPDQPIGWRVEFRPMEVQVTDFENAAVVCFVVLLTRVVLSYRLNFLLPISLVDENMQRAQRKDALRTQKFWFRRELLTGGSPPEASCCCSHSIPRGCIVEKAPSEFMEMTLNEIVNGHEEGFPGLVPLIHSYLSSMDVDADTHCTIQQYLQLIQRRASGELKTTARWIRDFVTSHPDYKNDSVVTDRINYDLLMTTEKIEREELACPELLGAGPNTKTVNSVPDEVVKAEFNGIE